MSFQCKMPEKILWNLPVNAIETEEHRRREVVFVVRAAQPGRTAFANKASSIDGT